MAQSGKFLGMRRQNDAASLLAQNVRTVLRNAVDTVRIDEKRAAILGKKKLQDFKNIQQKTRDELEVVKNEISDCEYKVNIAHKKVS